MRDSSHIQGSVELLAIAAAATRCDCRQEKSEKGKNNWN
jgi:hypothetical protein